MLRCSLATALLLLLLAAPARAERKVPQGYIGTMVDGVLTEDFARFDDQLDPMIGAGVESLRMMFDWREAQPYRRHADVPDEKKQFFRDEAGVPTDWRLLDAYVERAAQRRLTILPVIIYAPDWAAKYRGWESSPPSNFGAYAKFVARVARRYGRSGTFWAERPDLARMPIDWLQIWNEPHFKEFWSDQPWERGYGKLLRTVDKVVGKTVPTARIVAAGMANDSWNSIERLYRAKTRGHFDAIAVHPFTNSVDGVVEIIERGRAVMRRFGDRKLQLMVTEMSWTSAKGKAAFTYGNERTEAGQAKALRQGFQRMAKERRRLRIRRVYWYTWMTRDRHENIPFDYAGVVRWEDDGTTTRKPAYDAFRSTALALEGCGSKGATAFACMP
jgi:hypothetical protein